MVCDRSELFRPWRFDPQDMAVMAGWLAVAARLGYDAVLGICDDGTEWVGVAPPQLRPSGLWQILPSPSESGFVVLDRHGHPCFQSSGIRAVLHFVAPLPPGAPEPRPVPGERVPSIMSDDDPEQGLRAEPPALREPTVH